VVLPVAFGVSKDCANEQLTPPGRLGHERLTAWAVPLTSVRLTVVLMEAPCETIPELGLRDRAKLKQEESFIH